MIIKDFLNKNFTNLIILKDMAKNKFKILNYFELIIDLSFLQKKYEEK